MQYVNLTEHTLRFSIGGAAFVVETMGECEVPDALAYAVKGYGLPLTPKSDVEPTPVAKTPAPAAPVASEASSAEMPTVGSAEQASTTTEPRRRGR